MRTFYLSICLLICYTTSIAQDQNLATFEWSELTNNQANGSLNQKLVFPSESGFTAYSIEEVGTNFYAPKIIYISKFDATGKRSSSIDFKLPQRSRNDATLLKVIEGENKLYFFSFIAVKKDGKNVLYVQVYDNITHQVSEPKELHTIPIEKVNNSGFFDVAISSDFKTFAVVVNNPFVKKTNEAIEVMTFDDSMNQLSRSSHKLSLDSERAYNETVFVSNNGMVSIVKKTDTSKKHPITTLITINQSTINEKQISSEGFYISDSKAVSIEDADYLFGFSTDNAKPAVSVGGAKDNGFFIYNISEGKLIKSQEWSRETIKRVLGKGYIDLKVKDVLLDDQYIYLVGDCYSKDSEPIEGKNFEYNYTHRFGPGIVVKLDLKGNVIYDSPITYGEDYKNRMKIIGSFFPFIMDGKFCLLANEKESILKNKKIVMGYEKINAKAIVLRSFNDDGTMETTPFWNSNTGGEKKYTDFAPTQTLRLNEDSFYIYAIGKEMHKFGKMTLK